MKDIEQSTVRCNVEFYNEDDKQNLLKYPNATEIQKIVGTHIDVPVPEFLTYYLFYKKRPDYPGYSNYDEISKKVEKAYSSLEDFVVFNGESIHWPEKIEYQDLDISQHIGESIGLSVVNRIHGLHAADWSKIKEQKGPNASKVFDYESQASDGDYLIEVENKGSSLKSNVKKSDPIYKHRNSISEKKAELEEKESSEKRATSVLRYGTITALSSEPGSVVKCWITDPPGDQETTDSRRRRLLNRVQFLLDWISFISPRSLLAGCLATRFAALEKLENPFELNKVPLMKPGNQRFKIEPYDLSTGHHSSFLNSRSRITDGPAGGIVLQISEDSLFLLGIQEDLLVLAADQDLERITRFDYPAASINKTVECQFSKAQYEQLELPTWISIKEKSSGNVSFKLDGVMRYSREGLVFGILPIGERAAQPWYRRT